jgi:hypothetical protein
LKVVAALCETCNVPDPEKYVLVTFNNLILDPQTSLESYGLGLLFIFIFFHFDLILISLLFVIQGYDSKNGSFLFFLWKMHLKDPALNELTSNTLFLYMLFLID